MITQKQEQFLQLLQPVHARLWRFVLSITKDYYQAQDLLSETILASFERFETLKDKQAFTSFLFTIATRIHHHQQRRKSLFETYNQEFIEYIESTELSPDAAADISIVRDALSRLPAKQRETVVLFEISGFTLQEIRDIQGGTLSGVKSRLRRGRRDLARLLGVPVQADEKHIEQHNFFSRTRNDIIQTQFAVANHE